MRILHTIRSVNRVGGGPIEAVIQSSIVLSQLGHQVEIISLDSADDPCLKNVPLTTHALRLALFYPVFLIIYSNQAPSFSHSLLSTWNY